MAKDENRRTGTLRACQWYEGDEVRNNISGIKQRMKKRRRKKLEIIGEWGKDESEKEKPIAI